MNKVVVSIRGERKPVMPPAEMRLYLVNLNGMVYLRGEDAFGKVWDILRFNEDGSMTRIMYIDRNSDWPLDSAGRVALSEP